MLHQAGQTFQLSSLASTLLLCCPQALLTHAPHHACNAADEVMHLSKASLSLSGRIIVTPTAKSGALRTRTPEALVILNNFVRVNRAVMCSLRGRSAALRAGLSCCKAKEFIDYLQA